jgi:hypothetical protein
MQRGVALWAAASLLTLLAGSVTVSGGSSASARATASAPVVPLSVQRLIKKRAPLEAYIPTWLPKRYRYASYENLIRRGFDLYFARPGGEPLLGLDVLRMPTRATCTQGGGMKIFRVRGRVIHYSETHSDAMAWHCSTRGTVHVLVTANGPGGDLVKPSSLAWMDGTVRWIGR